MYVLGVGMLIDAYASSTQTEEFMSLVSSSLFNHTRNISVFKLLLFFFNSNEFFLQFSILHLIFISKSDLTSA